MENKIIQEQSTKEIEQALNNQENAVPYQPVSSLPNLGTVMPISLSGETMEAQYKFVEDIPDADEYLVQKLKYNSKIQLANAFGAEQADAVAFTIRQIEKDNGFILADMAGIGKGRVCAAVLRYAYVNDCLPIFITEADNLFSAIYRDLKDIGGLSTEKMGYPLILNGYISGGREKVYDESGKIITVKKPSKTGIIDKETGKELITAPAQDEIKTIVSLGKLPKKYDFIMLTYSQLSTSEDKYNFLMKMVQNFKGNVVVVMDECHNASGTKSTAGLRVKEIVANSKGVLYSSATFSKRPENMGLFAAKTDMKKSSLETEQLIEVIKKGGERLIENLASNLVTSQQMLRRERTFENCNVEYNYMSDSDKVVLFEKYDKAVKTYLELKALFSDDNTLFYQAKRNAVKRFAEQNKVELASPRQSGEREKDWKLRNLGKYVARYTAGEIGRMQFQFIETLLFALKANFVADQALSQLLDNNLVNMTTDTKEEFRSNRKPVISVRNTLESTFMNLGIQVGDEIDKADFSVYVLGLAKSAIKGSISLRELVSDKKQAKTYDGDDWYILDEDFADKGQAYKQKIKDIDSLDLDIPLSPIDALIDKIEATPRPSWDMKFNQSPTLKLGEVTGRKLTLKKQTNGKYKLLLNTKDKNKAVAFKKFNDGLYDVLLINESGSTGEDAHSSPKFKDTRPRVMIIHQVELDVNTEVQKRGRISRTGMLNYPTYIYAVSRIPSEIRRLLMLVKKLRTLDANTTGNQKQSAKLSSIQDSNGNAIQDVINKYGDECLEEFLSDPNHEKYQKYMPSDDQEKMGRVSGELPIETFVRNLELSLSEEQEYFYNVINQLYIQKQEQEGSRWDLETVIKDLKASIKTRVLKEKGKNTSPFDDSVYIEDDYVFAEDKPYTKDKVEELVLKAADGKDADEVYVDFLNDFNKYFNEVHIKEVVKSIEKPDYSQAKNELEKMAMKSEFEARVSAIVNGMTAEHDEILEILKFFKPRKPVMIPAIHEECNELNDDGTPKVPSIYNSGKFIGVKILKTAKYKYSPMNIELIFCQLSGKPRLVLKPTKRGMPVLDWVVVKSQNIPTTTMVQINNWEVDENRRVMMRVLTGNILSAYGVAKNIVENDSKYSNIVDFLKFTTIDNSSIRVGVRIHMNPPFVELRPNNVPVMYPINSNDYVDDMKKLQYGIDTRNGLENFFISVSPNNWVRVAILGGKMNGAKSEKNKYTSPLYLGELKDKVYDYTQQKGLYVQNNGFRFQPVGTSKRVSVDTRMVTFGLRTDADIASLKDFLSFIYSLTPISMSLTGVQMEETIYGKQDLFIPDRQGEDAQEEGEYGYDSLKYMANELDNLKQISSFDKYVQTSKFGTAYFKMRLTPRQAVNYNLIPVNNNVMQMVKDVFSMISNDNEKINFTQLIEKSVKEGKNDFELGLMVQKVLKGKILNLQNIFGYGGEDIEFVGDVIRKYVNGDIEIPKQERKPEEGEQEEKVLRPLDYDSAQDYVILLKYKLK